MQDLASLGSCDWFSAADTGCEGVIPADEGESRPSQLLVVARVFLAFLVVLSVRFSLCSRGPLLCVFLCLNLILFYKGTSH